MHCQRNRFTPTDQQKQEKEKATKYIEVLDVSPACERAIDAPAARAHHAHSLVVRLEQAGCFTLLVGLCDERQLVLEEDAGGIQHS